MQICPAAKKINVYFNVYENVTKNVKMEEEEKNLVNDYLEIPFLPPEDREGRCLLTSHNK